MMPAGYLDPSFRPLVLQLDQAADQPRLAGNKAANLARLCGIPGVRIPPGFVVTTEAYAQGMTAELRALITGHYRRLTAVGSDCVNALVAVRSSAPCEDLSDAAFAGQYLTLTNVSGSEAVLQAVQSVWNSTTTGRVSGYRAAHGMEEVPLQMGVLVQPMVYVRAGGTLFTLDPGTGLPFFEVSASWGLVEALVAGHITPDLWLLDPSSGATIKRRLGTKHQKSVYNPGLGTNMMIPTTPEERNTFCLQPDEIRELFFQAYAVWIGSGYGPSQHVEIEFALDNQGKIWTLQVRPETAWRRAGTGLMAVNLDRVPQSARVLEGVSRPGLVLRPADCAWSAQLVKQKPGCSRVTSLEQRRRPTAGSGSCPERQASSLRRVAREGTPLS